MPAGSGRARLHAVDGVLLLDKPVGLSSNRTLQHARFLFSAARAGHAGTLDPAASGLLVVCFGEATKFAQLPIDADKEYEARIRLGTTTTTGDAEGSVLQSHPVDCGVREIGAAMRSLTGEIEQTPPMYSALKRDGKPYYRYAREGVELERAPRRIAVREFVLSAVELPDVSARIRCSKGTYVRTLAEQLGDRLGCGAHLVGLRRTAVGDFGIEDAVSLEALEAMSDDRRRGRLLPPQALVAGLPRLDLDDESARRLRYGQAVSLQRAGGGGGPIALFGPGGELLGLGEWQGDVLRPRRLTRVAPDQLPKVPGVAESGNPHGPQIV